MLADFQVVPNCALGGVKPKTSPIGFVAGPNSPAHSLEIHPESNPKARPTDANGKNPTCCLNKTGTHEDPALPEGADPPRPPRATSGINTTPQDGEDAGGAERHDRADQRHHLARPQDTLDDYTAQAERPLQRQGTQNPILDFSDVGFVVSSSARVPGAAAQHDKTYTYIGPNSSDGSNSSRSSSCSSIREDPIHAGMTDPRSRREQAVRAIQRRHPLNLELRDQPGPMRRERTIEHELVAEKPYSATTSPEVKGSVREHLRAGTSFCPAASVSVTTAVGEKSDCANEGARKHHNHIHNNNIKSDSSNSSSRSSSRTSTISVDDPDDVYRPYENAF